MMHDEPKKALGSRTQSAADARGAGLAVFRLQTRSRSALWTSTEAVAAAGGGRGDIITWGREALGGVGTVFLSRPVRPDRRASQVG